MSHSLHFMKPRNKSMSRNVRGKILPVLIALVLACSLVGVNHTNVAAAGITYYVDNTNVACSDTLNDGLTPGAPFCTIGQGAAVAAAGDTVRVLAGTYAETVESSPSGSAGLPITYSAAPGVIVTGDGSETGSAFRITAGQNYITIDGFTVNSTAASAIYVSGANYIISNNQITGAVVHGIEVQGANNVTISNNVVSSSGGNGIYLKNVTTGTISGNTSDHNKQDGIRLNASTGVTVSNNLTFANDAVTTSNGNGIAVITNSSANTIIHNIVYANRDTGIQVQTSQSNVVVGNLSYGNGDHGIDVTGAALYNVVVGNTFQGNFTSGINLESGSSGATIVNNIVADNGQNPPEGRKSYNIYADSTSIPATMDYNLYWMSSPYVHQINWDGLAYDSLSAFQSAVPTQEVHGVQGDPLFVAPAAPASDPPFVATGDYHLSSASPAIDSANSDAPNEPALDIEGNARVDDPSTTNSGAGTRAYDDRGAYEFQAPIPCYTLTTAVTPAAGGTINIPTVSNCSGGFQSGTVVTVNLTIGSGQVFIGWSGDASGTATTINVTMDGNKSVIANFVPTATLISPTGTRTSWDNTFYWTGITGATSYVLEVRKGNKLLLTASPDASTSCTTGLSCSYTAASLASLPKGTYKWRVAAYGPFGGGGANLYGPWTAYLTFRLRR